MEYMGDEQWWNNRFLDRSLNLMSCDQRLADDLSRIIDQGQVLDVACGDGRNSIFLAKKGYSVEAIDFSKEALLRLNHFAEGEKLHIKTSLVDLISENAFSNLGEYDVIMINHYRLNQSGYGDLEKHLKKDGILWVNGFLEAPVDNPRITDKDLLVDEDFENIVNCELENKEIYENGTHKLVRYIWRKSRA